MSIDRQFGLHEIPGSEQPAPTAPKTTVSAGFELQMRGYVNAIWAKVAALEGRLDDFEGWRTAIAEALKERTGIDPRESSPGPFATGDRAEAAERPAKVARPTGEGGRPPPKPKSVRKPWEIEGVSRRTWYRRQKGQAA